MGSDKLNSGADSEGNSFMDNLKGTGEAWLAAGSALGDAVSGFAKNFREDRSADTVPGAHSLKSDVEDPNTLLQQLRATVDNARGAFNSADNNKDFRAAAESFATDTEKIFKDLAGSVSRASDATVESGKADQVRERLNTALGEVRDTFNTAVAGVRNRGDESDMDTMEDLRTRLDSLVSKVSAQFNSSSEESNVAVDESADIIDGEVVENDNPENS